MSQAGYRRLVPGKGQNLTLLSIELHADTRRGALPLRAHRHVALIVMAQINMRCPSCLTNIPLSGDWKSFNLPFFVTSRMEGVCYLQASVRTDNPIVWLCLCAPRLRPLLG